MFYPMQPAQHFKLLHMPQGPQL